jgi:hypothetical protein
LESSPDTIITTFLDEDGVVTELPSQSSEDAVSDESLDDSSDDSIQDVNNPDAPPSFNETDDPFVPSPFSPF